MGWWRRIQIAPEWKRFDYEDRATWPKKDGVYAVEMDGYTGDDEFGTHSYGSYTTFAAIEKDEDGGLRFSAEHDEQIEQVLALYGPINIPACRL